MSSADSEKREAAYRDYTEGMKYQQIADKYGMTLSAVKSWAARYWKKDAVATAQPKKLQPGAKKVATEKVAVETGEDDGLNDKQRLFCQYYVRNFNATQSYLKAYGCDYNTANAHGCEMLSIEIFVNGADTTGLNSNMTVVSVSGNQFDYMGTGWSFATPG